MKKHLQYLVYLLKHKWFVYRAGRRIILLSTWRLIIHDWSKFTPAEWPAYVDRFFGSKVRSAVFDKAVQHHYAWNDHHWEHWLIPYPAYPLGREMPIQAVYEMVADWCGAGRAISGKWEADTWYKQNREKINLHPASRDLAEKVLYELCANLRGELDY